MKKTTVEIFCEDTKKTYTAPIPRDTQLWAVRFQYTYVDKNGHSNFSPDGSTSPVIHLERETLERVGILPFPDKEKQQEPTETVEDLMLRLLEMVGVYPHE